MAEATNPVLPGFHPDPSIIHVGDTYYIATSTFEWWPGVRIYESRDLAHFRLCATPLDRKSQLDMRGIRASDGVWAPCLSHDGDRFYLVYTNVHNRLNIWDSPNFLVWADSIEGPWSEPVYLNAIGFDSSLFHDDDGRKWFVSMLSDHRPGQNRFAGIVLQEYDHEAKALRGPIRTILPPQAELVEGPHLFRHGGFYYLLAAYGGTGLHHGALLARSKTVDGAYRPDPAGPFLTAREDVFFPLQKAGHASLVRTPQGRWFISHLCSRPLPAMGRSILGRETAISEVTWTRDGWLRMLNGTQLPDLSLDTGLDAHPYSIELDELSLNPLPRTFQSLREPLVPQEDYSIQDRPGWLRLFGGESLFSRYGQRLLARRVQHFHLDVETLLEYSPQHFKHMAGLVFYYDNTNFYYLYKTLDPAHGPCLFVIGCVNGSQFAASDAVRVPDGLLFLRARMHGAALQFFYSVDGRQYEKIGRELDASTLSDEASTEGRFTGAMTGICCQDLWEGKHPADFLSFRYSGQEKTAE